MLGVPNLSNLGNDTPTAGFVFKPEEIETECRRHRRLQEAQIAQECNYDQEKFRQYLAAAQ